MSWLNSSTQKRIMSYYVSNDNPLGGFARTGSEDIDENQVPEEPNIEILSPQDATSRLELQTLEEQFSEYSQSPFNIAELQFNSADCPSGLLVDNGGPLELDALLGLLPQALPATKEFNYRARGYISLISSLQRLECSSDKLASDCSELLAVISVELDRLLVEVTEELRLQATMGTHCDGARRIHLTSQNKGRHLSPIVSAIIVLIAVIHCMMGVARDHCNLILRCLRCILQLAANMQNARSGIIQNHINSVPISLPTALHYLGLQDHLDIYAVCPSCDSLYKLDDRVPPPNECSSLNMEGQKCNALLFTEQHRGNQTWQKPIRRFTHQPLESWLSRFLNHPGIEDMLESAVPSIESLCTDVWGASYLSDFPGNGKTNFFEHSAGELRLAFLLYYDHFNLFMLKISGKKRSSGLVMMVCLNLPPEIRYDLKNIYVLAMLPGPKEPGLENINKFMHPIVNNLCEHYNSGVYISRTHKYPRGCKVQSAVPVSSMDIMASRPFAGIGGPSHSIFCSFCDAPLSEIDNFNLACFNERSVDDYLIGLNHWDEAKNPAERELVWKDHAVRRSKWSRFPWWNPFTSTIIAPMHWTKNVLEKQIRENMGCSTVLHANRGDMDAPPLSRPLTTVEVDWGYKVLLYSSADDFEKSGLPEPLLRFICRDRGIFEAGLPSKRLVKELNAWARRLRRSQSIIRADGSPTKVDNGNKVAIAKAEYYLSKVDKSLAILDTHSTVLSLQGLCNKYIIPWRSEERKHALMEKLVKYYQENVTVVVLPETEKPKNTQPLGLEVVAEIKDDMERTCIPNWMKTPPYSFATTDHGKLGSEEFKSLSLVSLPISLIRLWSTAHPTLRDRLTNFLHLSMAVRILSYQSLTEHDIRYFEYHYQAYVNDLKRLYPFSSVTPFQHLGLHIPYFMRTLGPPTRYSENTCEMFIGMLEEISTNSRIGELEQTLHRELIMAANLKATMERWNFSEVLQPFADIINGFLQNRYPGSERPSSTGWYTKHRGDPMSLGQDTYSALCAWANSNGIPPFTRRLHMCEQLRRGNVVYQSFKDSRGNSNVSFRPPGSITPVSGRIEAILQEPNEAVETPNKPRIIILA